MSAARALVLGIGACAVVACSGAQDKAQVQLATITAGCKVALERDAGEAGAADDTARGCASALHAWEKQP